MFQDYVCNRVRVFEEKADFGSGGVVNSAAPRMTIALVSPEQLAEGAKDVVEGAKETKAWDERAGELAAWAMKRLVVRPDAHGLYYVREDGSGGQCKVDEPITETTLISHFKGRKLIGLFSTSKEDKCLWVTIDVDLHDGDDESLGAKNQTFVEHVYAESESLGAHPLLTDSNGKGGFHFDVLFREPIPAVQARAIGHWLIRDWQAFGLTKQPEIFPKQDSIGEGYGNFVRLFGRHYKRRFYSRVFDGKNWLRGEEAIKLILSKQGDPVELFPAEAVTYKPAPAKPSISRAKGSKRSTSSRQPTHEWMAQYDGDLRTLDIVGLCEVAGLRHWRCDDREYRLECPWHEQHTSGDDQASIQLPDPGNGLYPTFHCFHEHCKNRTLEDFLACFEKPVVDQHCDRPWRTVINIDEPRNVADKFLAELFSHDGATALHRHQGVWYEWDGTKYLALADDDVRADLSAWLANCWAWTKATKQQEPKLERFSPKPFHVFSTLDALKDLAHIRSTVTVPSWLDDGPAPLPTNVIAFNNGLLDVEDFLNTDGKPSLLPHSPLWFSPVCLDHDFLPDAVCPNWLAFLGQVFRGDEERIEALARWFGYNLTWDTHLQAYAFLIGPPRSGKGTTMRVLEHLVGKKNVANPTLTSLGKEFGLASLIGKQVALVGDAHLGRMADSVQIHERLLSLTGEDNQNVNRKNKDELTNVRITARFTISANELPRFPDASAANMARILVIPFDLSFEGKEDFGLLTRLLSELPGITLWALRGLGRLRQEGRLLKPKAGESFLEDFVRLSSPTKAFLEDCCDLGPQLKTPTKELQAAWKLWCEENGHQPSCAAVFGNHLRAACSHIHHTRYRVNKDGKSTPTPFYTYVALKPEIQAQINNISNLLQ